MKIEKKEKEKKKHLFKLKLLDNKIKPRQRH
jgi:hypothetical protein